MGELHLEVLVTRMKEDFKVSARVGNPQVTYRESVGCEISHSETYSKVLGGKEQTAGITLSVSPIAAETNGSDHAGSAPDNTYTCTVPKAGIPDEIFDAVQNGICNSFAAGIRYGYPCTGIAVRVSAIDYNELTSTPFAFEACAAAAFENACEKADPQVLEPVMSVDIVCPKEFVGDAMSLLTQRGGIIQSLESKTSAEIVHAQAPMAKMFGFSTGLRSVTQGRASFSMEFCRFQVKAGGLGY